MIKFKFLSTNSKNLKKICFTKIKYWNHFFFEEMQDNPEKNKTKIRMRGNVLFIKKISNKIHGGTFLLKIKAQ